MGVFDTFHKMAKSSYLISGLGNTEQRSINFTILSEAVDTEINKEIEKVIANRKNLNTSEDENIKDELIDEFSFPSEANLEVVCYIQGLEEVSGYNLNVTLVKESRIIGMKNSPVLFEEFTYRYEDKSQGKDESCVASCLAAIVELFCKESE